MATTVTTYGAWGNVGMGEYRLRMTINRTNVNIANNTSTVRSRVWVEARAGGWFWNINSAQSQSIDGTQVHSSNDPRTVNENSSSLIMDNSRTITHNANGSRTVGANAAFNNYATGNISVSASLVLDTIPRATTPTTGGAFVTGEARTITLPRASTAFTHNLTYKVGTKTGTIATGAGASASWTPGNDLTTEFTKSASTSVTITTVTRSGSTTVGTKTTNFTLNAGSTIVPSISSVAWFDQNTKTTNAVGALVQGQSRVKGVITASGINGSTITTRRVTVSGTTYNADTVIDLPTAGTITATGTVTDSRGKSATANASFPVLPYDVPRLGSGGFQVQRANTSWVANDLGTNLIIDLHAIASSLKVSNVEKNLLTVSVHTRPASGGTWTARNTFNSALLYNGKIQVTGGSQFPLQSSFEVRITLNDKVVGSPTELITTIPTATVALDLNGTKVGIGKYHERGDLDVGGDIFYGGLGRRLTTDWDTATNPGALYTANAGATSAPTSGVAYQGMVLTNQGATIIHQILVPMTTGAAQGTIYVRYRSSTSWYDWHAHSSDAIGQVTQFAGDTAPPGWLLCQGQAVSRTTYAALYAVLGDKYGAGNGTSTFNVPDLRGRVAAGLSSDTEFNTLGKTSGAKTHTLTTAQMPSHTHTQNSHTHRSANAEAFVSTGTGTGANVTVGGGGYAIKSTTDVTTATNQNTGGGGAHNNIQPTITLNYIIRT